ncbi:MAG: RsmG family class I SAM-dependent methyltransferase [Sphingomonas sp.]|jgi:16S rRNA (guanine527-N7)-methyltransferase
MTEAEAQQWIVDHHGVSRGTLLARFVEMVVAESHQQNLISRTSMDAIWRRHVVDSAQLLCFSPPIIGHWVDIGTGAGFPGMVIALLSDWSMTLVEPRRRRAEFLARVLGAFDIANRVTVATRKVEYLNRAADVISARAVAPLGALFAAGAGVSRRNSLWILPKGTTALEEVAQAQQSWHGVFHVEHSITEPGSLIVTAKGVHAK